MKAHTEEQFKIFMSQLKKTLVPLRLYSDFNKISANVEKISIKLNQLNYLIGKEDIQDAVKKLWDENPKVFSVLDILLAVRKEDDKYALNRNEEACLLTDFFETPEKVLEYLEDTGLEEIFRNKKITNLVDYVFGVETGLDSNARKNRFGKQMTERICNIFTENDIPFRMEVNSTEFDEMKCLGKDIKRFDYVIHSPQKTYLIEVNFYTTGGSKLNEVARSYSEIAPKINKFPDYEFIWITDGIGWESARNKLEEAYSIIPGIYNLTTIDDFISKIKIEFGLMIKIK